MQTGTFEGSLLVREGVVALEGSDTVLQLKIVKEFSWRCFVGLLDQGPCGESAGTKKVMNP